MSGIPTDNEWRMIASGGICMPAGVEYPRPKVYGVRELARALSLKPKKVRRRVKKGRIPAPSDTLSAGPVWLAEDIEPWLKEILTPKPLRDYLPRMNFQRGGIRYVVPPSVGGKVDIVDAKEDVTDGC